MGKSDRVCPVTHCLLFVNRRTLLGRIQVLKRSNLTVSSLVTLALLDTTLYFQPKT
jgi:hypothetical protein